VLDCHSRENGNPNKRIPKIIWIPASAGMTKKKPNDVKEHYRKVQSLITTLKRYLKIPRDAKEKKKKPSKKHFEGSKVVKQ